MTLVRADALQGLHLLFPRSFFSHHLYSKVSGSQRVGKKPQGSEGKDRGMDLGESEKVLLTPDRLGERKVSEPTKKKKMGWNKRGATGISRKMYGS